MYNSSQRKDLVVSDDDNDDDDDGEKEGDSMEGICFVIIDYLGINKILKPCRNARTL